MKFLSALLILTTVFLAPTIPAANSTTLVSVASDGTQGDNVSMLPSISANARFIAFASYATNLISGDTNNMPDVFVHERETGQTRQVSVASNGVPGNDLSDAPSISPDGGYVAFYSMASNLVSGDTNGIEDIFVHNLGTGQTSRVSVTSSGGQSDSSSYFPSISIYGYYVAFASEATNLVSGDTNATTDVFLHSLGAGQTSRISVASDGAQGDGPSRNPSISADGRYVAFESWASNLVSGDTNMMPDIFVRDLLTNQTSRISVASDGAQGDGDSRSPSISGDGRYVAFESEAINLISGNTNGQPGIFVHDLWTGQTSLVSVASDGAQANDYSNDPSISGDGHYVAFTSVATNLVNGDTNMTLDVFVHDLWTGQTSRASVASDGAQGDNFSHFASISMDGCYTAFSSRSTNLVSGDTNGAVEDIFLYIPLVSIYLPLVTTHP